MFVFIMDIYNNKTEDESPTNCSLIPHTFKHTQNNTKGNAFLNWLDPATTHHSSI